MKDFQQELREEGFEPVDISNFFDTGDFTKIKTGIVVLTTKQQSLVDTLKVKLAQTNPEQLEIYETRMKDLQQLAEAIAAFPSLLERADLNSGTRTPQLLIDSLINHTGDGDNALHLPSKATLGRGFLIAKLHTFSSLTKLTKQVGLDEKLTKAFNDETVSMMFLLLAEDVYLNLIRDTSLEEGFRRQLATSLLLLWEHRADQNIADIAPVLQSVWMARRTLAPAFGTMMGTSELIMISFQLGDDWSDFIKEKLGTPDVNQAMEEFLFGISYEQINKLKSILREKGIAAIGRDEVSAYLGEHVKTDVSLDYRDFFTQYSVRRDNARARKRLGLQGPHRTLEDHFISYIMEKNKEKQQNDIWAK